MARIFALFALFGLLGHGAHVQAYETLPTSQEGPRIGIQQGDTILGAYEHLTGAALTNEKSNLVKTEVYKLQCRTWRDHLEQRPEQYTTRQQEEIRSIVTRTQNCTVVGQDGMEEQARRIRPGSIITFPWSVIPTELREALQPAPAAPGSTTFRVTGADASVTGGGPVRVSRTISAEEIANGIDEAVAEAVANERKRLRKEFADNTAALRADLSATNTWLWRLGIWAAIATVLLILVAGLLIGCFWCRKHPKKTTVVSQQPPRSNGNGPPRTATEPVAPAPTPASPAAEDRKETAPKADPGKQNLLLLRIRGMLPGKKDEAKTTTAHASDTELKGAPHDSDQTKAEQKPCVSVAGLAAFVSPVPIGTGATPAASTKVGSAQPREEAAVQSTDGNTSATEKPCDIGKFLRNNRHGSHLNGSSREQGAKRCSDRGLSKSLVRLNGSNVDPGSIAENQVAASQTEDLIYQAPEIYDHKGQPVSPADLTLLADPRCVFDPWTPSFVRNRTNDKCGAYFPPGSLDAGKPKHGFLVWLEPSTGGKVSFPNKIGIALDPKNGESILNAERQLFGDGSEPHISSTRMVQMLELYP